MPVLDPRSRPVRVAFVGREVEHRHHTLTHAAGGFEPSFVDHRDTTSDDALAAALREARPDVVVSLRPLSTAPEVLRASGARAVLALLTEPLGALWVESAWEPDLAETRRAFEAGPLATADLSGYDRVLAWDPLVAHHLDVWRSPPAAVDDALFLADRPPPDPVRPLFLGESSYDRERILIDAKHHYELSHYAYGLSGERLRQVLAETNVGVVVHALVGQMLFAPEAALHLAAGHLLITNPLVPLRGLEPGLDHLVIFELDQLLHVLHELRRRPKVFEHVRLRGRLRAEELRASRVWPRLLHDLGPDLEAFG